MNPHEFLRNLPTFRTRRLILRPLRMEDQSDYFAFASDPQVVRYLRWGPHASLQDTEAYLKGALDRYGQGADGLWGIELAAEGRLTGTIHLMDVDFRNLKADMGVVVHAGSWRKGIGSEALRRILQFSFENLCLQRVQGLVITGNTPACRMMQKCGMTHEGVLRRYALQKGAWWDFDVYSILRGE